LRSQDGRQIWNAAIGAPIDADGVLQPTVGNDLAVAYVTAPSPTGPIMSGMVAVELATGAIRWHFTFEGRADTLVDLEGDQIYVPEESGDLPVVAAYSLETVQHLWSYAYGQG
jgi:hypothetical protein